MISQTASSTRIATLFSASASERSVVLRLALSDSYFGYFYYADALASGRCFASGRSSQE
jgi:hypothetical protein